MNDIERAFKNAKKMINNSNNIMICSHVNPDGDSIGSILSLGLALKKIGKKIKLLKVDIIPDDFDFLPSIKNIQDYDDEDEIDLFISMDCSDIDRLGKGKLYLEKAKKVLNIDHHVTNTRFGDINLVLSNYSSTGEISYQLIKELNIDLDEDIATNIYTAISTDTGRFMYVNTSDKTHNIVAELIRVGIDTNNININLYQNRSLERTYLLVDSLKTLELHLENKIGLIQVTQDMINRNNASMHDSEGIVTFIKNINTIEVACLFKEVSKKEVKVSLRSKNTIDVSEISQKFGGGGHLRASGFTLYSDIENAMDLTLKEILNAFR